MKALILSGGKGSRLRPLTHTGAKQLIPVANKPIIYYGLEDIVEAGIKDIGIIVGKETKNDVKRGVGDGKRWGVNIQYIYQEEPLGIAHCVKISRDFLMDEPFIMYLGDNILATDLSLFIREFEDSSANALVLLTEVDNPQQFGVVELDDKNHIKRLVEKPKKPPTNLALVGVYLFDKNIYKAVEKIKPSWRNELEITDAIQWLIDNGYKVLPHKVQGWWKDTGKPEDVLEANRFILSTLKGGILENASIDSESAIEGEIQLEEGVRIQRSVIRGPVVIGKGTKILNSYIGPYTSIYYGCTIKNSEIENSIILENTKIIDSPFRLDSCLIGKEVEISKGSGKPKAISLILGDRSKMCLP
ncbi:MAG: glucose-1-phosphate thymidylyltransferase [candidate division WOR-3 bacterium]|nr:glucose-1-phosphate thymidylyltransferase [candidate division WOR-3 bacterium]